MMLAPSQGTLLDKTEKQLAQPLVTLGLNASTLTTPCKFEMRIYAVTKLTAPVDEHVDHANTQVVNRCRWVREIKDQERLKQGLHNMQRVLTSKIICRAPRLGDFQPIRNLNVLG